MCATSNKGSSHRRPDVQTELKADRAEIESEIWNICCLDLSVRPSGLDAVSWLAAATTEIKPLRIRCPNGFFDHGNESGQAAIAAGEEENLTAKKDSPARPAAACMAKRSWLCKLISQTYAALCVR